jgi:hypothetical protein
MGKKVAMAYFEALSQYPISGGTGKTYHKTL